MSTSEELRKLWTMDPEDATSWPFAEDWKEAGGDISELPIWPDGKPLGQCSHAEVEAAVAYHREAGRRAEAEAEELTRLGALRSGEPKDNGPESA